ncbi:MAG: bifunctional phosphoglucose/phosphomannose isomerase [Candidatus Omnitrophica bacterium]|nr:bifunctional phosphoglucose/phosphomannose isomerase [Candidatus Omnitrophota bacterium]MBU1933041.1 bifunctional phosphoglucose/phosphomannose isomerase [Candidatus Omnitrophota bacterium]
MNSLDNRDVISKLDASSMLKLISGLPDQCREAGEIGKRVTLSKPGRRIDNIVFAGLGGSAIGADVVRIYLQNELKVPVVVSRNYTLPDFAGNNTLLFCASYSGNTEETLSSFKDGLARGTFIITMGSGGKLKEQALKNNFKHIDIPKRFPPRTALGFMSITVLVVLSRLGFIKSKDREIEDTCSRLAELRDKEIGADVPFQKNISKKLASAIHGRYAIVYGTSDSSEAASIRWRGQIAENAKALASSHVLPEMNHNEIVGWEFPRDVLKDIKVIFLRDKNDHPRTQHRVKISMDIIKKSGAEIFEIERKSGGLLARMFSLIYIGDFVSFYLAILNNIDPTPVKCVDYLKEELAKI